MPLLDLLSFFVTVLVLALAPGPAVLLIMVRAASNDIAGAIWFGIGVGFGGIVIIAAVCFGLSAWFSSSPEVFVYSKYFMLAYISWIAWTVWKGGFDMSADCETAPRSVRSAMMAGFITCFLSPYYMIILPLMLPEIVDIRVVEMPEFLGLAATTFLAMFGGAAIVAVFAAQLRRLARSARSMKIMHRSLAVVLMLCGGWMTLT